MSQSVTYAAEWACENNPTVGMSDKAMMAHYKANALAGDIRFYLSTQAASLKRLQAQLDGVCAKQPTAEGQRAACQGLLKPKKAA